MQRVGYRHNARKGLARQLRIERAKRSSLLRQLEVHLPPSIVDKIRIRAGLRRSHRLFKKKSYRRTYKKK